MQTSLSFFPWRITPVSKPKHSLQTKVKRNHHCLKTGVVFAPRCPGQWSSTSHEVWSESEVRVAQQMDLGRWSTYSWVSWQKIGPFWFFAFFCPVPNSILASRSHAPIVPNLFKHRVVKPTGFSPVAQSSSQWCCNHVRSIVYSYNVITSLIKFVTTSSKSIEILWFTFSHAASNAAWGALLFGQGLGGCNWQHQRSEFMPSGKEAGQAFTQGC